MTALRPEGRYQPEAGPYEGQPYGGAQYGNGQYGGAQYDNGQYGNGQYGNGQHYGDRPYPGQGAAEDAWGVYEQAEQPAASGPEYPWLPDQTLQLRLPLDVGGPVAEPAPPTGGRAERRRAAQGRTSVRAGVGRRRAAGRGAGARVRPKESAAVVTARLVGELCITLGVVMLLFVSYQLWWTNVQADAAASGARNQLEQQFDAAQAPPQPGQPAPDPAKPEAFEPGKGFAIIYLPKLGLKFPIAEGTSKPAVLDKGLVGHYTGTGMPADKAGNFALAAHRNTHGEPFRYINQLGKGDKVVVETATAYYTYEITGGIPETSPNNVSVIKPVPNGAGYAGAGRYITLTTCTPEFTSKFRLIVFGKMTEERPRSQGKPAAITGG
ncbi:class E sortase [Kitasatospora sp. NPDC087314]|uniref:class E sortase n=1 Tax=Kitasatospora sp. NPDC087314 TaxID=3364068 RepID=UPI003825480A